MPDPPAAPEEVRSDEVAGSPGDEHEWVRRSARKLARRLKERGLSAGRSTAWALLKRAGSPTRTNVRRRGGITRDPRPRGQQSRYTAARRKALAEAGPPVIRVDARRKGLSGSPRNPGRAWCRRPPEVNEHDHASQAGCLAVPLGVRDVARNKGYVAVGRSHNTPGFAAASTARRWGEDGRAARPAAKEVLTLADGGGGNGSRARAGKLNLPEKRRDRCGPTAAACHHPPGCPEWDPVAHRLLGRISGNWEGKPLGSLAILRGYIRGTTTTTGLTVKARPDEDAYQKGPKVTRAGTDKIRRKSHGVCSVVNYTLTPRR